MEIDRSRPADHQCKWPKVPENQGPSEERKVVNLGDSEGPVLLGNISNVSYSRINQVGIIASGNMAPSEQLYIGLEDENVIEVADELEVDNAGDELLPVGARYQYNMPDANEGKYLEDRYGDIGTESAVRVDTIEQYRELLEEEINILEKSGSNPDRLKRALNERDRLVQRIKKNQQATWIKSQEFRDLVKKTNYENASNAFTRGCPVNLRIQRMTNQTDQEIGRIGRLGAITDVTNGWFSCEELVEMQKDLSKIDSKIREIQEAIDNPKPSTIFGKIKKSLFNIKPKLNQDQMVSAWRAKNALLAAKNTKGEILTELIQDREEQLERQALQYLIEQIKANPKNIKEGQPFNLIQLSLLNLKKKSLDSSGWMHDEAAAFRDFRYIMQKLNGKQILFADAGPYIDGETIVLQNHIIDEPPLEPVNLKTFIFNLSVQGNTKNEGLQKEHNDNEIIRFIQENNKNPNVSKLIQINRELMRMGSSSSYHHAEELGVFLHDFAESHGALGLNCVSGKDRTGYVASRIMIRKLKEYGKVPRENRIFGKSSIATKIARDNLPNIKVLKIDPLVALNKGLPGISKARYALTVLPKSIFSAAAI